MMLELHFATLAPVLGALDFGELLLGGVAVIFGVVLLVSASRTPTSWWIWSMVAVTASSWGVIRRVSTGAVQESGAQSSWVIH